MGCIKNECSSFPVIRPLLIKATPLIRPLSPKDSPLIRPLSPKVWFMAFNATFNNISVISWWSELLVEETRVPGENQQPVASRTNFITKCYIEYTSP
jgi:hypothetical protein